MKFLNWTQNPYIFLKKECLATNKRSHDYQMVSRTHDGMDDVKIIGNGFHVVQQVIQLTRVYKPVLQKHLVMKCNFFF